MTVVEIILLALALSVDAFVVSFSYGIALDKNRLKNAIALAVFTGGFQGLMPVLAYFLTTFIKAYISPYTDFIVFTIFLFLGLKFIKEAFEVNKIKPVCISLVCLFLVGIATSIDAFSAGITLMLYGNGIVKPALLITLITFINSILGFMIGSELKKVSTKILEICAGIILVGLGINSIL